MNTGLAERLREQVTDGFLLHAAERNVSSFSDDEHEKIRLLYQAGTARLRGAEALANPDTIDAALVLDREAAQFFLRALELTENRETPNDSLAGPTLWRTLSERAKDLQSITPESLESLRELFTATEDLAIDRLSVEDALQRQEILDQVCSYLKAQIEPRTLGKSAMRASPALAFWAPVRCSWWCGASSNW